MRNPNRALAHSWMNRAVRVLNATYEYLGEVSADRAVVLIATGSAQSTEDVTPIFPVRSKHVEIPLPSTILLAEYVYVAHRVTVTDSSRATFAGVFDRDGRQCAYCAARATTIDHVQPRSRNGPNTWGKSGGVLQFLQSAQGGSHSGRGRYAAAVGAEGTSAHRESAAEDLARIESDVTVEGSQ